MSAWTRTLKFLATGTISLLLTSCYGTVQVMYGVPITFRDARITTVTASSHVPIQGLKVSYTSGSLSGSPVTGTDGTIDFLVDTMSPTTVTIADTDGPAHGGDFSTVDFTMTGYDQTIEMSPK